MNLIELILILKKEDPNKVIRNGFSTPHSYRGYYDQLAFKPAKNVTVGSMLANAASAMHKTFHGWKGGEYFMDDHTDVWLAEEGRSNGLEDAFPTSLLEYMLKDTMPNY